MLLLAAAGTTAQSRQQRAAQGLPADDRPDSDMALGSGDQQAAGQGGSGRHASTRGPIIAERAGRRVAAEHFPSARASDPLDHGHTVYSIFVMQGLPSSPRGRPA